MTSDPFMIAVGIIGARELTDELLGEVLGMLPKITPGIDANTLDRIRKQLETTIGVSMVSGEGLHGGDQQPWLEEVKASISWNYWNAYVNQLKSNGFGSQVVRVLDEDTDNILNECGNPGLKTAWRVQGLVMGDVQSGKTANYCGLINKAADAGYKVIVLLTGMIEELRAQSQERLDEGFVGRDSRVLIDGGRAKKAIGAGRFRPAIPNVLTSIDSDFLTANKRALGGIPLENIKEPVLLVMKKNCSPLQNLISFLDSQMVGGTKQLAMPLLLVDDEADNASVNAKKDEDPAKINKLIRDVLKRFGQTTYVGYTATPFANVFINPDSDDLFPKNFVYSLNTPTSYIGVASIFSDTGSHRHQLLDINDADASFPAKHKKDLAVAALPSSMEDAIGIFLLSCAIRDHRKEPMRHRSMLVNVTRFTDVQVRLSGLIKEHLYELTELIKQYLADDDLWHRHARLVKLHELFTEHYSSCGISWDKLRKQLFDAVAAVKVLTINQKSDESDRLNYRAYRNTEKGRRVIAVGGLTLSRGLTLEGLCVSYFYRDSKAYDTLLQMGRWFGYRPGYADLCRVWMDPDVQDWFAHIADVVDELRMDIRRMHANKQPPERFGMRVRSHADALIVTAANKMRNAREVEVSVSFSKYGAETPFLPKAPESNAKNLACVNEFLTGIAPSEMRGNRFFWGGVKAGDIAEFLRKLEISTMNAAFIPDISGNERPLISFVANNGLASLEYWDVCLPQGEGTPFQDLQIASAGNPPRAVLPRKRQFEKVSSKGSDYLKINKQRVGEISDELVDLEKADVDAARKWWDDERKRDPEKGVTIPGYVYRAYRTRPLLTIHLIEPSNPKSGAKNEARMMKADEIESRVLVAVSLSFPDFGDGAQALVPYRLNKVALRTMGLIEDEGDDEDED